MDLVPISPTRETGYPETVGEGRDVCPLTSRDPLGSSIIPDETGRDPSERTDETNFFPKPDSPVFGRVTVFTRVDRTRGTEGQEGPQ